MTVTCSCSYADTYVRTVALNSIRDLTSDELLDYLPQLVQVSEGGKELLIGAVME